MQSITISLKVPVHKWVAKGELWAQSSPFVPIFRMQYLWEYFMKSYETGYPNNWGMGVGAHETEISTEISVRNFCHIFNNKTFFRKKTSKIAILRAP